MERKSKPTSEIEKGSPDIDSGPPSKSSPRGSVTSPGNPGFAGYMYQVDVSIWAALELILVNRVTESVTVEPVSQEDLEAMMGTPDTSKSRSVMACDGPEGRLILQVKTRKKESRWTLGDVATILRGPNVESRANPSSRVWPLDMLLEDSHARYVFVTNAPVSPDLEDSKASCLVETLVGAPYSEGLANRLGQGGNAPLLSRIRIMPEWSTDFLKMRILEVLAKFGNVTESKQCSCLDCLRKEIIDRMCGLHGGVLDHGDLRRVIADHGGLSQRTQEILDYVPPSVFDAIDLGLATENVAVIAGPAGTGKTLTGEVLEMKYRLQMPPFEVAYATSPSEVREKLKRPEPILFHLQDPLGMSRLQPGSSDWGSELPKLVAQATPGKKFLITTRSDVLESAGHGLAADLGRHTYRISAEDYSQANRQEMYRRFAERAGESNRQLARQHETRATTSLSRPYEIVRFVYSVANHRDGKQFNVFKKISEASIGAIADVLANQIDKESAKAAAVLWALMEARREIDLESLPKVRQRLRHVVSGHVDARIDLEGLATFLVNGENYRKQDGVLKLSHPKVQEGLRKVVERDLSISEPVLDALLKALIALEASGDDLGVSDAFKVFRASSTVDGLEIQLDNGDKDKLDDYLLARAQQAEEKFGLREPFVDLARYGSARSGACILAKKLVLGGSLDTHPFFRDCWSEPQVTDDELAKIDRDPRSAAIAEKIVRSWLADSGCEYPLNFVSFVNQIVKVPECAYWDALELASRPEYPPEGIASLVGGALSGEMPDYERAIGIFAKSFEDAEAWRREELGGVVDLDEEGELDKGDARLIEDRLADLFQNAKEGFRAILEMRLPSEGLGWIAQNGARRHLEDALAAVLREQESTPDLEAIEVLLDSGREDAVTAGWKIGRRHWNMALAGRLQRDLRRPSEYTRRMGRALIRAVEAASNGDVTEFLGTTAVDLTFIRRLELLWYFRERELSPRVGDGVNPALSEVRCQDFAERMFGANDEKILARAWLSYFGSSGDHRPRIEVPSGCRDLFVSTIREARGVMKRNLVGLGVVCGVEIDDAARDLARSDNPENVCVGIDALWRSGSSKLREFCLASIKHERAAVRKQAFSRLVESCPVEDRPLLCGLAEDRSALVRESFATAMLDRKWPQAETALVRLLEDSRNFRDHTIYYKNWPDFEVAKAAARALGRYNRVDSATIDGLLAAAQGQSKDPELPYQAMCALARQDDPRVVGIFEAALEFGNRADLGYTHPVSQGAASACVLRVEAGFDDVLHSQTVAKAARGGNALVAGRVLVAYGAGPRGPRNDLLRELDSNGEVERARLVRIAAICKGKLEAGDIPPGDHSLLALRAKSKFDSLTEEDQASVMEWIASQCFESEMEKFSGWLLKQLLGVPMDDGSGRNPLCFRPPDMTLVTSIIPFSAGTLRGE